MIESTNGSYRGLRTASVTPSIYIAELTSLVTPYSGGSDGLEVHLHSHPHAHKHIHVIGKLRIFCKRKSIEFNASYSLTSSYIQNQ